MTSKLASFGILINDDHCHSSYYDAWFSKCGLIFMFFTFACLSNDPCLNYIKKKINLRFLRGYIIPFIAVIILNDINSPLEARRLCHFNLFSTAVQMKESCIASARPL